MGIWYRFEFLQLGKYAGFYDLVMYYLKQLSLLSKHKHLLPKQNILPQCTDTSWIEYANF